MKFTAKIKELKRLIARTQKQRQKLVEQEARARDKWRKMFNKQNSDVDQLATIKVHGTLKEKRLQQKVIGFGIKSAQITVAGRDTIRDKITALEENLIQLGLELARVSEQQNNEVSVNDEIVTQVFALNATVVRAAADLGECLKRHVFPRLITDGKLCSQVTFDSADDLRRVIAMVNTMTIVRGDLANSAQSEIEKFFAKFQATAMDHNTKALFELTKQILVEKTNFKVGPDLYRFLGMELDPEIFPELSLAQMYLRQSIRSEKTNSYIRIFERKSRTDKWQAVPQS